VARILGGVAYERGLYPAAVQFLKQSAQAFPSDGDLYYMLGLAQHQTKASAADCSASLNQALTLAPDSPLAAEAKSVLASMK
jgi:tetratricopeptide (TPR) repeat protein